MFMTAWLVREQSIYTIGSVPNHEARQDMASACKILMFIVFIIAHVFSETAYAANQPTQGNKISVQSTLRNMHANCLSMN